MAVTANHEPSAAAGLDLLALWADSLELMGAGGIFYFLSGKPLFADVVLPALSQIEAADQRLLREIEELRQRYEAAGLIPSDMDFPTLYTQDYLKNLAASDPDEVLYIAVNGVANRMAGGTSSYQAVQALPEVLRHIYTAWWVEAEVMNGGLEQYFWNSAGDFAVDAAEALAELGLIELAELLRMAIVAQMKAEPDWRPLRNDGSLEAFSASYDLGIVSEIGDQFKKLGGSGTISDVLRVYACAHLEEIAGLFSAT